MSITDEAAISSRRMRRVGRASARRRRRASADGPWVSGEKAERSRTRRAGQKGATVVRTSAWRAGKGRRRVVRERVLRLLPARRYQARVRWRKRGRLVGDVVWRKRWSVVRW